MKAVLKSFATGVLGMALFFCFFALLSVPVLMIVARFTSTTPPGAIFVAPAPLFRHVGLPLSAIAFLVCFILAMKKFGRQHP